MNSSDQNAQEENMEVDDAFMFEDKVLKLQNMIQEYITEVATSVEYLQTNSIPIALKGEKSMADSTFEADRKRLEQGEEDMNTKKLDDKIEEFSTKLTNQFGNIFQEIKGMPELTSSDETEAEIVKRLQSLNADNEESVKQLEEVKENCDKIKTYIEDNYKL
ncbi:unnamed protein product [Moneuplotes crassus]|uniref:Mediator of RNA polymerase II transcription subunit 21 n=1 Tax=Euplotes crassus TaxID=5936 RepID=A0AAD2D6G0_EUPCR|nr:unnamed protein product [Moneuplotes crassus]